MVGYLNLNFAAALWMQDAQEERATPASKRRAHPMPITLEQLFQGLPTAALRGPLDRSVSGIAIDSRRAVPGSVFFALPGRRADGHAYIDEAVRRGAIAVVTARPVAALYPKVTFIQVAEPRAVLASVASRFYGHPDRDLRLVGVTGTNGKTTTAYLCRWLLSGQSRPVGMLGTVQYDLGARTVPSYKTTPESVDIYGLLSQMRQAGCRDAAMEVSSHGIDQLRVAGLQLKVATFLNLTRDHLDYHGTLEDYFAVKARLFTGENGPLPAVAVVNADDAYGRRLIGMIPSCVRVLRFGLAADAEVRAEGVSLGLKGATFTLHWPGGSAAVRSPLVGAYNVSNALAALASCIALGEDPQELIRRLEGFTGVPGRMERIEEGQPFQVLVDYAHTDDALRNALGMLRPVTPGRVLAVFGCGGNRDRTKRPLMAAAVEELADLAWATSDNPRTEPPGRIFEDMRAGLSRPDKVHFVEDRRRAISLALDAARPGDCLLIAGKGHETFQEFADTVVPFDDRQVARELLAVKRLRTGEGSAP